MGAAITQDSADLSFPLPLACSRFRPEQARFTVRERGPRGARFGMRFSQGREGVLHQSRF